MLPTNGIESDHEPDPPANGRAFGWAGWLAVIGLGAMTAVVVFVGVGYAAIANSILGSSTSFASLLIPTLIAGALYALLTIGLVRRSRIAYVIAFLVAAAPAGSWVYLAVIGDPLTFQPIPLILGTPPLLVVVGLAASWRTFWEKAPPPSTR